ncbi:MAG: cyclohexanecarboxylate-CoA ligase [Pseudonocardiales bacterium]|nr:cyclohexanecarboxylate-CoA ligase [Pseudonocardiales bacterium]
MWDTLVRPPGDRAESFRASGRWRSETVLDDLRRSVAAHPDKPAIISYSAGSLARIISYQELSALVDRFAAALLELGVRRQDVVALHLPNWWMLNPLYLACARIGAVPAPVMPTLGARELGLVLAGSAAKVCIVPDSYLDVDYLERLADAAPDTLAHRVVVRTAPAEPGSGDLVDFGEFFVDTPWEQTHPLAELPEPDPDDVALLLFTSGTTGAPKAVAHSHNTLYAAASAVPRCWGFDADCVASVPHPMTHLAGVIFGVYLSVILGGTCAMQDDFDMDVLLDMIATHGLTFVYAGPPFVIGLVAAQRERSRDISSLKALISGSAPIPPQLVDDVREVLGVELGALWGMTENGSMTVTRPDDPQGWAAHSDGSPVPGVELRIDAEDGESLGRLLVRSPSQCLGYLNQREVYQQCLDSDGWFDTGDMARPDGRGGIRITGRRDDLIIRRWGTKVPTLEVEAVLLRHPRIREVVLIGYPDAEIPTLDGLCAVLIPDGQPPSVEELSEYLDGLGMTFYNWPDRVEIRAELPKNPLGKVQRGILRKELEQLVGDRG